MPDLGWQELMIILVIVIIIFGAGKLPEIGGAMGKSIKEFKKASETEGSLTAQTTAGDAATAPGSGASVSPSTSTRAEDI
jgi:sec-independent protein translocase protein TatA